jgi:transcriptional regulator with XRE-family HTH domain
MSDTRYVVIEDLHKENKALREALKQARLLAQRNGYTMSEFAANIGITPTQLSKWTDSAPNREPDFKD